MTSTPRPETPAQPTTRERLSWATKNSRVLIIALLVLVVAALVAGFSLALFTSSSANPGNMTSSGIMEQDNSQDGLAILTVDNLLPGEDGVGEVTISNVGDADGDFELVASNLVDDPADPAFSRVLTLVITDGTTEVYNGALSDIRTVDLGTWPAEESHTYTFTVTFASGSGNEYQDATSTVDFTWDAQQSTS